MAGARLRWLLVGVLLAAAASAWAQDGDLTPEQRKAKELAAQQQLAELRSQIRDINTRLQEKRGERDELGRALREQDLALAAVAKDLRAYDQRIAAQQAELSQLEISKAALTKKLGSQREALATLLRSAYALGRHEELKLLLQQDDVAAVARALAYHRYFQQARVAEIAKLQVDLQELASVQQRISDTKAELDSSRLARVEESRKLDAERVERSRLLSEVEQQLKSDGGRLDTLGKDERGLIDLLEQLHDVFADIPSRLAGAESFVSLRGKLAAPVAGTHLAMFGSAEEGGRRSDGLRIAAKAGTSVRAVAYGRVVFADWFKGYGLMVIIDHGDNYLSLYGYNETLQRDVGDWVQAGEVIASSGASGGQRSDSVYFELRQNGQPIDPKPWLKR